MIRKLSCVILVVYFFIVLYPLKASAGVEPSPFFSGPFQSQLETIRLYYSFDKTVDSLNAINLRLTSPVLNSWVTQELADHGTDTITRISAVLTEQGLPSDYVIQLVTIMDWITRIMFDPQPEPPGVIAQGFTVLDRISWVLFDPQPEPPGLPPDLQMQSIRVMYQVAGVIEQTSMSGLLGGTIPGLNALEQLSGHLVDAVVRAKPDKAAAQVNAMSQIAEQLAGY